MNEQKLIDEIKKLAQQQDIITGFFNGREFVAESGATYPFDSLILTNSQPGEGFIVKKDDKWLCVVGNGVQVVRTQIITDKRKKRKDNIESGSVAYLYTNYVEKKLRVEDTYGYKKEITIDGLELWNPRYGYIHNLGEKGKYRLAYQDGLAQYVINFLSKNDYSLVEISFGSLTLTYKGNLIWDTGMIAPNFRLDISSTNFDNPGDSCSSYTENIIVNDLDDALNVSGTLTNRVEKTGNWLQCDITSQKTLGSGSGDNKRLIISANLSDYFSGQNNYEWDSLFDFLTEEIKETTDTTITANNAYQIKDAEYYLRVDYSYLVDLKYPNGGAGYLGKNVFVVNCELPVIYFESACIYFKQENYYYSLQQDIETKPIEVVIRNLNENFYLKTFNKNIKLNNSPFLRLVSRSIIDFDLNSTFLRFNSFLSGFSGDNYLYVNYNLSNIDFRYFENIEFTLGIIKEQKFYELTGVMSNIHVEQSEIFIDLLINNIQIKEFISYASENGTLMTKNGSIYNYLHLESTYNLIFPTTFNYSEYIFRYGLDQTLGRFARGLDYPAYDLQLRFKKDFFCKNKIYVTNIPNFSNGGEKIAYIEVWEIDKNGNIFYKKTIKKNIKNIPANSTLLSASYHP